MTADAFSIRHIPALFVATTCTFGGIWPLFNPKSAMLEFGFAPSVAESPAAGLAFAEGGARTTVLGMFIYILYFRGQYAEIDTLLALWGVWCGIVDSYLVYKSGSEPGGALSRLVSSWIVAGLGFYGVTQSSNRT